MHRHMRVATIRPNFFACALIAAAALVAAEPAFADVLINATPDYDSGTCGFNTTCGPNSVVAQGFDLSHNVTITSIDFQDIIKLPAVQAISSVNWAFRAVEPSGEPGAILASGSSVISSVLDRVINHGDFFTYYFNSFDIGSVSLSSGAYFLTLQAVTSQYATYWGSSSTTPGRAYVSYDGTASWSQYPSFAGNGFAFTLNGTIDPVVSTPTPEPAAWAMLLGGFGLIGAAMRRKRVAIRFA